MEAPAIKIPTLQEFVDGELLDDEARKVRAKVQRGLMLYISKNFEFNGAKLTEQEKAHFNEELQHRQLGAEKTLAIIIKAIGAPFRNWLDNVCVANGMTLEEFRRYFESDEKVDKSEMLLGEIITAPGNYAFESLFRRVFIPSAPVSKISGVYSLEALRFLDEDTSIPHLPDMTQSA